MHELSVSPEIAGYILAVQQKCNHKTATETVAFLLDIRFYNQLDTTELSVFPIDHPTRMRVYLKPRHFEALQQVSIQFGIAPGHLARVILVQLFSQNPLLLGVQPRGEPDMQQDAQDVGNARQVVESPPHHTLSVVSDNTAFDAAASFDSLLA